MNRLKFIDSLQFTPQSLDSLVKTLEVDEGVYPYHTTWIDLPDLMNLDCLRRMHSSASIRTRNMHTQLVWTAFECKSMADYHDIYNVLLLADVFEKFRASCLAHYSLDAVHYYTASGLACDAALRMTHVSLELITDIGMYHFIENSIRGGISMITTRYAQANFPTLPGYDASDPHVHLIYLDANNLYWWPMSQSLPTGRFRFLRLDEIEALAPGGGGGDVHWLEVVS